MNPRFVALTFGACTLVFAGVWAITAPAGPTMPVAVEAPAILYADCDALRSAGAAPLRAGQPGYRPALDPNMNGMACETVGTADTPPVASSPTSDDPTPAPPSAPMPDLPDVPPPIDLGPPPPPVMPPLV